MKTIISLAIITVGLVFFLLTTDEPKSTNEISITQEKSSSIDALAAEKKSLSSEELVLAEGDIKSSIKSNAEYAQDNSKQNHSSSSSSSNYNDTESSYQQDNSNYGGGSYWQDNATYKNNSPSSSQNNTNYSNSNSSYNQKNSTDNTTSINNNDNSNNNLDNSFEDAENDQQNTEQEDSKNPEDLEGLKYQRIYDGGVAWYGDKGTLTVEYQASNPETTGIGFRLHYDSSSMRVVSVNQYPVDAITSTSARSKNVDAQDRDNNPSTDSFLPFAWASIYGQWPQMSQVTVATVEFEKTYGNSNYRVNYSPISVSAGYQFIP